ncbi:thiol-disulfide oxidoreductase DCC family protein [Demequina aurantiaca]|uniref:thiol-disulfide oxidoreductase DCC family protein n=1 Tax=Demequina aurantiaca TaxID=676200 RepID=UPI003D32F040
MSSIVVFDGECALCNGFVSWLIRHDREGRYLLAGSAGEVGREVIRRAGLPSDVGASTIVLWEHATPAGEATGSHGDYAARTRSDAVLTILGGLGLPWKAARAARIVPRSWRDRVYGAIAARRARVEAEDPSCGVPPAELVELWRSRLATLEDIGK